MRIIKINLYLYEDLSNNSNNKELKFGTNSYI